MSQQLELRVRARGSTDAADQAKRAAREQGYRIQTVAAIRPAAEERPDPNELADWIVTLAVRDRDNAMSEDELVAGYGGLPPDFNLEGDPAFNGAFGRGGPMD